jgi:stalled ribosome rescue protein Dom34
MDYVIFADEMLENENETLRERVGDLEKKVYEQRDEILCLRATLADVLRRITNLEGIRGISNFFFYKY